ncbi:hypothetical protein RCIA6 [Methanocella arvoryzae MRE50]|uniref:Uncharacterized protein n=1 Tax=Methanocella arvoryzae (strain DSM 22066 / NBRC 105507 / MRE50) TaxID=351160 RepID=Q0W7M1_METAR|nr:hypothetical protein RCIA6 [Methanocella arvoryzae MRE50]
MPGLRTRTGKIRGRGVPGDQGDFSNWEVREVRRSERSKVRGQRIGEGKLSRRCSPFERLPWQAFSRRISWQKNCPKSYRKDHTQGTRSTRSFTIRSYYSMPLLSNFEYFVYFGYFV